MGKREDYDYDEVIGPGAGQLGGDPEEGGGEEERRRREQLERDLLGGGRGER